MLPRRNRLCSEDFEKIIKEGNFFPARFFSLRILKNNLNYSRFGIVVGGKVTKKAVSRNKIRRRSYEIIRREWSTVPMGFDIVFFAKKSALEADFDELKEDVLRIIKTLNPK